ncbi:MAG: amino-acid N-acetyltransferase [Methylococcaceae bacterium]|nr:amino-acid N-acetyltransferase [Methylococcaceae bacterium]
MSEASRHSAFVRWFRDSSPYIHAHRGRTFVVSFGGEALADGLFSSLVHDFALLNGVGIRLVLVHGARPQVEQRLQARGSQLRYVNGLRVTDATALECVKEAVGTVRVEIEALLSMGLANSPMAGARIRVATGNFVIAKPLGVHDGVDFGHTGKVRRVDEEGIRSKLDQGDVVLLSPIGYSPTGEVFNLSAEEVATAAAIALHADKLLLLTEQDCVNLLDSNPLRQLTTREADGLLETENALADEVIPHLKAAVVACRRGVQRAHLLNRRIDGTLLLELFTRDGVGTLVSLSPFEEMRQADIGDVGGILELIKPLEEMGVLTKRSREFLEMEIDDFSVIERDGAILGCAALHVFPQEAMGELACLALHPDYRGDRRGERLMEYLEAKALNLGLKKLFVLTTQTTHWFREHGYEPAGIADLPLSRQAQYNHQRNSKILVKTIADS